MCHICKIMATGWENFRDSLESAECEGVEESLATM